MTDLFTFDSKHSVLNDNLIFSYSSLFHFSYALCKLPCLYLKLPKGYSLCNNCNNAVTRLKQSCNSLVTTLLQCNLGNIIVPGPLRGGGDVGNISPMFGAFANATMHLYV